MGPRCNLPPERHEEILARFSGDLSIDEENAIRDMFPQYLFFRNEYTDDGWEVSSTPVRLCTCTACREILRSAQDDMQKAQADAKDAREAAAKAQQAGAEAERLRGDIEVLRKQLSIAAPAVAEFKAAFDRAQDELVHMTDALHRIQDEETRGKLRKACAAMLDGFMGRVKE